jgi:predicted metal-dependent phosphoesterase TrpH
MAGLTAIAVTDHDTIDALDEAFQAAEVSGLELVPGIELAIECSTGRFHMLGYLINPACLALRDRLRLLKENRSRRNERMVARMQELGLPVTREDVLAESGGGQVGRPHMALALMRKGVVSSVRDAFDRYLADGAPAHIPKDKVSVEEGIDIIHRAGGLAVLAHPSSLKLDDAELARELHRLKWLGLDGLECYYSQHTPERTEALLELAGATGLLVTGGSDFHGAARPGVILGVVYQGLPAPAELLDRLKAARSRRH